MKKTTFPVLIIITSLFLLVFFNFSFFSNILEIYPINLRNLPYLISLSFTFLCINILLLSLLCYKHTTKPVLIFIITVSSITAYFMDTYHIFIDDGMIDNVFKTNYSELSDLMSLRFLFYLLFLGLVPSFVIYNINIIKYPLKKTVVLRTGMIGLTTALIILNMFFFGNFYATFFREHKPLRFYANPVYYLYSAVKYTGRFFTDKPTAFKKISLDAEISHTDIYRDLVILIIGETARADHFSLNGYNKKTNPYLEKENVISFKNTWACGTSTTESLPCMFSMYNHSEYKNDKALATENVLDILQRAGVNVIWLDNNSNSREVAKRIPYIDFKTPDNNPVCDIECRDEGMLVNLQNYIDEHPQGDIFIVLHQMGSHGPAYYKRYPPQFEKFTPVCKTNQLENCSQEEIANTYDNTILYTDYFLYKTIALLKRNDTKFETSLFYISDHGESLGENGLYLHGLPYSIAPDEQKHVPMILWFGNELNSGEVDLNRLREKTNNYYSHDNIFHTILGLMEIKTAVYNKSQDIIDRANQDQTE